MSRIKNQAGFSVVELLITLITIGVVFGAFLTTFTTIQVINKRSLDINTANSLAFAKMQEYENKTYDQITDTTPSGTLVEVEDFSGDIPDTLENPRIGKVYVNTVSNTLKHVVISVEFGEGGSKRTMQYANFIQQQGVGR